MCNYLDKVGSTYYFRRAVPDGVRPFIRTASGAARTEWKFSLHTKDRDTAKRLVPSHTLATDAQIDAARAQAQSAQQAPQAVPQALSPRAEAMAAATWEARLESEQADSREVAAQDHRREDVAGLIAFLEGRLRGSTAEMPRGLRAFRYIIDSVKFDRDRLRDQLVIAKALPGARVGAIPAQTNEHTDAAPVADAMATGGGTMLDTTIVDLWAAERKPVQKGIDTHRAVARWFYEREGQIPVDRITRKQVLSFKNKLVAEGQSPANINMKLSRLRTLLQWAFNNDHTSANVADGITIKDTDRARNQRLPFDLPALRQIFSGPVHANGARPAGGKGEAAYWLPLLALFTGARLEELGQLRPGDVAEMDYPDADGGDQRGWFIRLTEDRKDDAETDTRLKNADSERVVPLHPALERLGFIKFVEAAIAAKTARLFPLLKPNVYGRLSAKWGEWFGPYLRTTCGITDKRMVFHSFRHTFKHYARSAGIIEGVQRQIMGHSPGDTADEYGNGYPLHQLVAGMATYRVPGLIIGV